MAKFQMDVTLGEYLDYQTARLADDSVGAQPLLDADVSKFVKLKFTSQYGLCAAGDEIEGILESGPDSATLDGFKVGTVRKNGRTRVKLKGFQGTPGVGVCAVGDYVVCGGIAARGTSLADAPPEVYKATAVGTGIVHTWRIVALYTDGAVNSIALIERV